MKKNYKKLFSIILISGITLSSFCQSDEITKLMKAGKDDIQTLADAYLKPLGTGFAANMGQGWYNTGAVHKLFGFDITLGVQVASAPTADQNFTVTQTTFKSLKPVGVATPTYSISTPTFAGKGDGQIFEMYSPAITKAPDGSTLPLALQVPAQKITELQLPGVINYIPGFSAQVALGLPFGTELKVRFVPTIAQGGFKLGLWGIGIQHDFKQWIPVVKELPFDASAVIGYTSLTTGIDFDPVTPESYNTNTLTVRDAINNPAFWETQKFEMKSSALTVNVVVSKKLLFFTPYLGFGFTNGNFDLKIKGNYPIIASPDKDPNNQILLSSGLPNPNFNSSPVVLNQENVGYIKDPIKLNYSSTMPNLTVGFRLKILWVLAFHGQYTLQKYPIISGGFGINFR